MDPAEILGRVSILWTSLSVVLQKLGVLDTALAQPSGRHMLQALPPDVLAAILSYDTLAATSENTVLAAGT